VGHYFNMWWKYKRLMTSVIYNYIQLEFHLVYIILSLLPVFASAGADFLMSKCVST